MAKNKVTYTETATNAFDNALNWVDGSATVAPGCRLTDGVTKSSLSGCAVHRYYYIDVPAGKTSLTVAIAGGTGDADLFVRYNAVPTTSTYTCQSINIGNNDSSVLTNPSADRWYIMLFAYTAYSGVGLNANYAP